MSSSLSISEDLPLCSNIEDIRVRHYVFVWYPDFTRRVVLGRILMFCTLPTRCESQSLVCSWNCGCSTASRGLEVNQKCTHKDSFEINLDMKDLVIKSLHEVECDSSAVDEYLTEMVKNNRKNSLKWFSLPKKPLSFVVSKWKLSIRREGIRKASVFPFVLCLSYKTKRDCQSLLWTKDIDGNDCVFVKGSPINNRGFFPYQDSPSAFSTWEAVVITNREHHVSMTGDASCERFSIADLPNSCLMGLTDSNEEMKLNLDETAGFSCFYAYTSLKLPLCTLAFAVGTWNCFNLPAVKNLQPEKFNNDSCRHVEYPCALHGRMNPAHRFIDIGLVCPASMQHKLDTLKLFVSECLKASISLLGPYLCPRLEIAVMPNAFDSLGLASPNLIFLAPCVAVSGDTFSLLRIAHEISHTWFGVSIGAADWTEEWLSEGFATYMEEAIFLMACQNLKLDTFSNALFNSNLSNNGTQLKGNSSTLSLNEFGSTLIDRDKKNSPCDTLAVENTSSNLLHAADASISKITTKKIRTLRINNCISQNICYQQLKALQSSDIRKQFKDLHSYLHFITLKHEMAVSSNELQSLQPREPSHDSDVVTNALNKEKTFLSVHYLKGYFLLKFMSQAVCEQPFLEFLRKYVFEHHGTLITSNLFLDMFYEQFPNFTTTISKENLVKVWLKSSGMNMPINAIFGKISNVMFDNIKKHSQYWQQKNLKSQRLENLQEFLFPEEIVLLLEDLIASKFKPSVSDLTELDESYGLSSLGPEVLHRWCELIVQHNYSPGAALVRKFLVESRAMGVYLYGELTITEQKYWQELAKEVFRIVEEDMDRATRDYVRDMICL